MIGKIKKTGDVLEGVIKIKNAVVKIVIRKNGAVYAKDIYINRPPQQEMKPPVEYQTDSLDPSQIPF